VSNKGTVARCKGPRGDFDKLSCGLSEMIVKMGSIRTCMCMGVLQLCCVWPHHQFAMLVCAFVCRGMFVPVNSVAVVLGQEGFQWFPQEGSELRRRASRQALLAPRSMSQSYTIFD
jgi:hypothetical protein